MNHTPGPWTVFDGQYPIGTISINKDVETRIATIEINDAYSAKESAGNAVLIAAAPDLLDALKSICEMNYQQAEDQYGDRNKAKTWRCVITAESAIKKATEDLKQFE